ncbi:hypothetical protein LZ30DRAFT_474677 [Colletotrichum cereale]|nr:hypothetical protein LZ30DRAFT_474677 [Colletotrichum cereale]
MDSPKRENTLPKSTRERVDSSRSDSILPKAKINRKKERKPEEEKRRGLIGLLMFVFFPRRQHELWVIKGAGQKKAAEGRDETQQRQAAWSRHVRPNDRTVCVVGPGEAKNVVTGWIWDGLGGKSAWKLSSTRTQTLRIRIYRGYCLASKTGRTSSSHPWVWAVERKGLIEMGETTSRRGSSRPPRRSHVLSPPPPGFLLALIFIVISPVVSSRPPLPVSCFCLHIEREREREREREHTPLWDSHRPRKEFMIC